MIPILLWYSVRLRFIWRVCQQLFTVNGRSPLICLSTSGTKSLIIYRKMRNIKIWITSNQWVISFVKLLSDEAKWRRWSQNCKALNVLFTGSSSVAPVVFNVSPRFGPVAGGTLVTISGLWLNYADSIVALYLVDQTSNEVVQLSIARNIR